MTYATAHDIQCGDLECIPIQHMRNAGYSTCLVMPLLTHTAAGEAHTRHDAYWVQLTDEPDPDNTATTRAVLLLVPISDADQWQLPTTAPAGNTHQCDAPSMKQLQGTK